ncbi:MAG: chromosome segregation protein SMC [Clostridia bacterium]|nr:chromosome segregation protein SMC [Clostridia bacterium]
MQLTKLEINGFKSFAKKTELIFEQGITGILGPNGCGKSNIADAFRFVLGEQSARALRGKKVEDFIFGGTEKRKHLSYCEVSMYFDNTDGSLASPYSEVAVSRRAFRSGESEYYINKSPCRLKDIQDLFRDTGIGKDGYSIIGQGRVSDILSDRSNERRVVFEDAAGVMRYRSRKEEAERKLANTSKNLVRLEDILYELEQRVEPLREQSEKALEFVKLREELREMELGLFLNQYDRSNERIKLLNENAEQLQGELNTAIGEEEALASSCATEESAERKLSESISEVSQQLITLSGTVESGVGDEKLLNERIGALDKETQQCSDEIAEMERKLGVNSEQIGILEKSVSGMDIDSKSLDERLENATADFNALDSEIGKKEATLESKKQAMMDAMNRLADTRSSVSRLEAMRESLLKRLDELALEREKAVNEGKKLDDELRVHAESITALNGEKAAVSASRNAEVKIAAEIEESIRASSAELRKSEDAAAAMASRCKVLDEMKRAHEGYYASVRKLLNGAQRDGELSRRIHGVVAELISVPEKYEKAVEMALGSALQNIIVPTEQDAKAVIEHLRRREYGRATLLPVSIMRSRLLTVEEKGYINIDGCFGVASDLIGFSAEFRSVIENLLGRTVIVRDIDVGIAINKRAHSAFRIATLDGDILNPGGSMTGGSVQKREFSLLGRERELEELTVKLQRAVASSNEIRKELSRLEAKLGERRESIGEFEQKLRETELALASLREKEDITKKYIQKNGESIAGIDEETGRINDSVRDIDEKRCEAEKTEQSIEGDNEVTGDDIRAGQQELFELRSKLQQANNAVAELQVLIMAATKEKASANAEITRLNGENALIVQKKAQLLSTISSAKAAKEELLEKLKTVASAVGADKERVDKLTDELRRLEAERAQHLALLDDARTRREKALVSLDELKERLHKNELNLNKLTIDLQNMVDRIWEEYELTYENAQDYRKSISTTQMHSRCDELKKQIRALGEVNTASIEDYKSVKERYEDLSAQCADLRKAEADLNELIGELTETMEKEFVEQFAKIQTNFSETFQELFGGGHAELVLSDKSDVLNSNIDIIAQPPGKKLQLLTLLSGGEQALTAISLLFAILRLKPAAFCILDEIDSALDEANVDNYANFLSDYAKGTQFIIITHRKGAMAVCDALYGVSMEEKGVSTLVSAKFN